MSTQENTMIGLTVILYLVALAVIRTKTLDIAADIAVIRTKTLDIAADIALLSKAATDGLQRQDLRVAAGAGALAASLALLWWRACYVISTIVALAIITYLW